MASCPQSTMPRTNTGDPLIHGVVTHGLEYSCLTMPVYSLSQQPCFILLSAEESLSVYKAKGGLVLLSGCHSNALFCSLEILESSVQMLKIPLTPAQKSLPIRFACLDTQDLECKNVLQEKTQKTFTETLLWGHPVSSSVCVILDKSPSLLTRGKIINVCYRCVVWHGSSADCERYDLSRHVLVKSLCG